MIASQTAAKSPSRPAVSVFFAMPLDWNRIRLGRGVGAPCPTTLSSGTMPSQRKMPNSQAAIRSPLSILAVGKSSVTTPEEHAGRVGKLLHMDDGVEVTVPVEIAENKLVGHGARLGRLPGEDRHAWAALLGERGAGQRGGEQGRGEAGA